MVLKRCLGLDIQKNVITHFLLPGAHKLKCNFVSLSTLKPLQCIYIIMLLLLFMIRKDIFILLFHSTGNALFCFNAGRTSFCDPKCKLFKQ